MVKTLWILLRSEDVVVKRRCCGEGLLHQE